MATIERKKKFNPYTTAMELRGTPSVPSMNEEEQQAQETQTDNVQSPYQVAIGQTQPPVDQYDSLRAESARDLLDRNVTTFISNQAAKRNAEAELRGLGLANSGYVGTANAMLGNDLSNNLAQNQRDYQRAMMEISSQEYQDNQEAQAAQASLFIEDIGSLTGQQLEDYLTQGGFTKQTREDGTTYWYNPNWTQTQNDELNRRLWLQNTAYDTAIGTYGTTGIKPTVTVDEMLGSISITGGVKADSSTWGIRNEVEHLLADYPNGAKEGFVVRLTNGNSDNHAYLVFRDGAWHQVSEANAQELWESTAPENRKEYKKESSLGSDNPAPEGYEKISSEERAKIGNAIKAGQNIGDKVWINGETYEQIDGTWYKVSKKD